MPPTPIMGKRSPRCPRISRMILCAIGRSGSPLNPPASVDTTPADSRASVVLVATMPSSRSSSAVSQIRARSARSRSGATLMRIGLRLAGPSIAGEISRMRSGGLPIAQPGGVGRAHIYHHEVGYRGEPVHQERIVASRVLHRGVLVGTEVQSYAE